MELVDGTSLRAFCGEPQPIDRVLQLGSQIAEALSATHAMGTVHRDIKPENILVRRDGYVKVLDFGLAYRVSAEALTATDALPLGTPRYLSPEQAKGEPVSAASDIFSFGMVLYELAAGRHPFPADSPIEAVRSMLDREPAAPAAINPLVPPRLNSLILAMLAKDPSARPSAEEVARTLHDLQRGSARKPSRGGAWIAICMVLAGSAAALYWSRQSSVGNEPTFTQITTLVAENRATAAAISPDGKLTVYANVDGIFIRARQKPETTALNAPRDFIVDRLAWFADGTKLVASGFSALTNVPGVWTIFINGEQPSLLRTQAREATPSPDGTRIAFISQDRSAIWTMGTRGEEPKRIVAGSAADTFPLVFWSPDGRRVAFQLRHYSPGRPHLKRAFDPFHERSYQSVEVATGRVTATVPDIWINSASALPDGRILFMRWDPPGSPAPPKLWEVKTDLATGAFLGAPRKITNSVLQHAPHVYGMSATADGRLVTVLNQFDQNAVFVGDFHQAPPRIANIRRLTLDDRANYPHGWTRDGRSVLFESLRNATWDLFKQEVDQRTPVIVVATPLDEVLPQMEPDGHWVLYSACLTGVKPASCKLMRAPVDGGTPEEVPIGGPLDEFRCALGAGKRCVLRITAQNEYRAFYDLDPIRGKGRELARTRWLPGFLGDWDISPDGTQVAIPNHDSRDARIRIVSLERGTEASRESELVLAGLTDLRGLVWAADGTGWFVSVDTTVGNRLLYVWRDGRFRSLGDIQGWAVPSPDRRRVAFLDRIVATNAWLIERR
jgi:hypothetical protein